MKAKLMTMFKNVYPGKRLLSVQLNGFNHTIFFDSGSIDAPVEVERYSLYTDMEDERAKTFFETLKLNMHQPYKHQPEEHLFIHPKDR